MTKAFLAKVIERGSFSTSTTHYVLAKYREDSFAIYAVPLSLYKHRRPLSSEWRLVWHGDIREVC